MTTEQLPDRKLLIQRRPISGSGDPRPVRLPGTLRLAGALPLIDWSDAYQVELPPGAPAETQVWSDAIFHGAPGWVRGLLAARQATVPLVGIDRGRPGTFETLARTGDEVLLGTDERHLSFRASVRTRVDRVVLSTVVQVHDRRGRAYSSVVRAVHPFVARAVLGLAVRILSATTQGALR